MHDALARELETIDRANLRRVLRDVTQRHDAAIQLNGATAVDFSSNDYLGLASDPRVIAAAKQFLTDDAIGAGAARLISGNHPVHTQLERELARLKGTEATLLFSSGYTANLGAIPALVGKRDVIYADELNHASLIDAVRLSRAEIRTFPHADLAALRELLHADAGKFRRRLIVVDGVFSMDGDLFPLDQLVPLAREFDAWTYVDDAHATALVGPDGGGTPAHFGVSHDIDVVMGTLGKALGTAGAFIAGSATLIDFLLHRARAFVFTTASPPVLAAAALKAIQIAHDEPWRREKLRENARRIRRGVAELGYQAPGPDDGYIIPVIIGDSDETMRIGAVLRDAGYLVGAVRPPSVPRGTSRLRITVTTVHTSEQIDGFLHALGAALAPHVAAR